MTWHDITTKHQLYSHLTSWHNMAWPHMTLYDMAWYCIRKHIKFILKSLLKKCYTTVHKNTSLRISRCAFKFNAYYMYMYRVCNPKVNSICSKEKKKNQKQKKQKRRSSYRNIKTHFSKTIWEIFVFKLTQWKKEWSNFSKEKSTFTSHCWKYKPKPENLDTRVGHWTVGHWMHSALCRQYNDPPSKATAVDVRLGLDSDTPV